MMFIRYAYGLGLGLESGLAILRSGIKRYGI